MVVYFYGWKGQKKGTVELERAEKRKTDCCLEGKGQKKERLTAVLYGKGKRRNG